MKRGLIWLLVAVFSLRLGFVYFQYSGDVNNHLVWGHSLLEQGSFGLFSRHFPGYNAANYPPVAILLFGFSVLLHLLVVSLFAYLNDLISLFPSFLLPLFQSLNMQAAFAKLPAIFADIGIGYLIYLFTKKKLLSALYLFNPAVIYVSTVWGQIEAIPIFFLLLALYFTPRRYYLSHAAFLLAVLSKQIALWFSPIFAIIWLKEGGVKKLLRGLTLQAGVFFLLYLPFALPLTAISLYFTTLAGSSSLISDQAFNLWYWLFAGTRLEDSQPFAFLTVRLWSLIILGSATLVICLRLWRHYSPKLVVNSLFWLSLAAFFLQTRVHDRHLAPALPLLLLTSFPLRSKLLLYLILSAYHMINLYSALGLPFI